MHDKNFILCLSPAYFAMHISSMKLKLAKVKLHDSPASCKHVNLIQIRPFLLAISFRFKAEASGAKPGSCLPE